MAVVPLLAIYAETQEMCEGSCFPSKQSLESLEFLLAMLLLRGYINQSSLLTDIGERKDHMVKHGQCLELQLLIISLYNLA